MDPTAALHELRRYVELVLDQDGKVTDGGTIDPAMAVKVIAEKARDLDRWMSTGGFSPEPWTSLRDPDVARYEFDYWRSR